MILLAVSGTLWVVAFAGFALAYGLIPAARRVQVSV
jgi:hypothetical protein